MVSVEILFISFIIKKLLGKLLLISRHYMFKTLKYKVEREREFEGENMILQVYSLWYLLVCIVRCFSWFKIAVSDLLKQTH